MPQKEIAKTWLIPKQTVNTVVKELERQGYVFFQTGKKGKAGSLHRGRPGVCRPMPSGAL